MTRDGTRTVLSMQNNYEGPPENFAMVVPVPVVLQKENVKTLPRELFAKLEELDAPRLVEYWEQDPCALAAEDTGGPFAFRYGDVVEDLLELRRRCDWPDIGVTSHWIAEFGAAYERDKFLDERVMYRLLDKKA